MDKIYQLIVQFLKFSHHEARGFFGLVLVSLIALFFLFFPGIITRQNRTVDPVDVKQLDSLAARMQHEELPMAHPTLFLFDPNEVSADSLLLLGFPQKVAERLINYRTKGGRFYIKKDVKKIYGITDRLMDSIYNFINLPDSMPENRGQIVEKKFDLNSAASGQLKKVSMIGDVLAGRIVKYRDLLGGYINMDQLDEVYGLSEGAKKHLKSMTFIDAGFKPRLIKVNRDSEDVIRRHPYISNQLAADMVSFREINSTIKSEKVLANFKSLDKAKFEKLIPYLDFQ